MKFQIIICLIFSFDLISNNCDSFQGFKQASYSNQKNIQKNIDKICSIEHNLKRKSINFTSDEKDSLRQEDFNKAIDFVKERKLSKNIIDLENQKLDSRVDFDLYRYVIPYSSIIEITVSEKRDNEKPNKSKIKGEIESNSETLKRNGIIWTLSIIICINQEIEGCKETITLSISLKAGLYTTSMLSSWIFNFYDNKYQRKKRLKELCDSLYMLAESTKNKYSKFCDIYLGQECQNNKENVQHTTKLQKDRTSLRKPQHNIKPNRIENITSVVKIPTPYFKHPSAVIKRPLRIFNQKLIHFEKIDSSIIEESVNEK
jgi:hypothetical protein